MNPEKVLVMVMLLLIFFSLLFAVQGEILNNKSGDLLEVKLLGSGKLLVGIYLLLLGILVALLLQLIKLQTPYEKF